MPINHEEKKLKKSIFAPRENIYQVEEGELLSPKFDQKGLIPCIITDYSSKEVLMHAYMNTESLEKTIKSGQGHYWSRSRKKLWKKGSSSGMIHKVKDRIARIILYILLIINNSYFKVAKLFNLDIEAIEFDL